MTDQGRTARMIEALGNEEGLRVVRPCAFDDIGEMVDIKGTGLDSEYDAEMEEA